MSKLEDVFKRYSWIKFLKSINAVNAVVFMPKMWGSTIYIYGRALLACIDLILNNIKAKNLLVVCPTIRHSKVEVDMMKCFQTLDENTKLYDMLSNRIIDKAIKIDVYDFDSDVTIIDEYVKTMYGEEYKFYGLAPIAYKPLQDVPKALVKINTNEHELLLLSLIHI